MAEQQALWHDTIEDALRDVVQVLGGPKRVAADLWPGKAPSDAARHLNHCLDPDRPEKLALGEFVLLLSKGSEAECHTAMHFLADAAWYERPQRKDPETEKEKLQREYMQAVSRMEGLVARMQKLSGGVQ